MATTPRRTTGWGAAAGFSVLLFSVYLAPAPRTTLWDRDEAWFGEVAVEMAASGNALVPTFNGEPWAPKPPLTYWLMSLTVGLLGATELAARIWAPVGVALAAFFTFAIGRKLFSARVGLLAMLMTSANPLMMVEGSAATADAILLAAITAAVAAYVWGRHLNAAWAPLRVLLLAIPLAVGQLIKGPVGLVVPLLAVAGPVWLLDDRSEAAGRAPRRLRAIGELAAASVLSVLAFAIWAIPAGAATGGRLTREFFGVHIVQRVLTPIEGHGGNLFLTLPFYLPVVLIGFSPWTVHLPGALRALARGAFGDRTTRALLAGWIVLPVAAFSLAMTKLPHYVLPIWPALALAVAATLEAQRNGSLPEADGRWLRRGIWFLIPVVILEIAALAVIAAELPVPGLPLRAAVVAAAVLAVAVLTVRFQTERYLGRGVPLCAAAVLVTQLLATVWLLPSVEAIKPVPRVAGAIRSTTPATTPVATFGFDEPSLVFYVGRPPVARLSSEQAVATWARSPAPGVLVVPRPALARIVEASGSLPLTEIAAATGINVAKGRWLELVAVRRGAFR